MITITLAKIKAHEPCEDGWDKILAATHLHGGDYDKPFPVSAALETNGLDDTLWALKCLPGHDRLWRKYAVWCARQVQHLMKDRRSIDALDVADRHADGLATDYELAAAGEAAWAAAGDARDAAWAAARAAAWAAAGDARAAARVTAGAAAGDARAAAWAAAGDARAAARVTAGAAAGDARAARVVAEAAQSAKLKQMLDAGIWVDAAIDAARGKDND